MAALSLALVAIVAIVMLFALPHERAAEALAGGVIVGEWMRRFVAWTLRRQ